MRARTRRTPSYRLGRGRAIFSAMTQDPSDPSSHLPRGLLLAAFVVLLLPAGLLLAPDPPAGAALSWFVGILPILLWAYAFRWRGAMAALSVTLGVLVLVEAALLVRDLPPTPLVLPVAGTVLAIGVALALLLVRVQQDRGTLEEVALTDRLTGLPNRRHARVFLETMFGAAERGRAVALVLFDLDDFRGYNDRMGRKEGDEALRAFAALLASSTRRMNLSARLGGEEFISILAGSDEEGARAFADRVRETFRLSRPAARELTISAGVAAFHPSMRRPDELVGAADLALYRAKEAGGDRVRVFGRDIRMEEEGVERSRTAPEPPDPEGGEIEEGLAPRDGDREKDPAGHIVSLSSSPSPGEPREGPWKDRPHSGHGRGSRVPAPPLQGTPSDPGQGTEFARPPELLGRSIPPPELLPPVDPRFGTGHRVLLVGGEEDSLAPLRLYMAQEGFLVEEAPGASDAMLALGTESAVLILDARQLGDGSEHLVRATRSRWPATQILLLHEGELPGRSPEGLQAMADDVLGLPTDPRALQSALVDALGRRERQLAEEVAARALPTFAQASADAGERLRLRGLLSLVRAGELRDRNTRGHAARVARYASALLEALPSEQGAGIDRERLVLACLLHDIGKIEIPEAILVKNAPLTADEFGTVREHPESGRAILRPILPDPLVLAVTGWHHERWDGSGYPDGLAGLAIPLPARIVAIADALDAMSSPRAYRSGLLWEDAVRQIRERFGSHYDPNLTDPFRKAQPELLRIYRESWGE